MRTMILENDRGIHVSPEPMELRSVDRPFWIDGEPSEIAQLKEVLSLHELALDGCRNQNQRAKLDAYPAHHFLVFNRIGFEEGRLSTREIDMFLNRRFIITVHREEIPEVDSLWQEVRQQGIRGIDFLLHRLLDGLVARYFPVIDKLGDRLERLEESILSHPEKAHLERLFWLKRQTILLRKILGPQRDTLFLLTHHELPFIGREAQSYFLDVYDHGVRVLEVIETYRDLVGNTLDAYLSAVSNRTNEIMRTLTAVSIIFMPLTLIAGIYGMNFQVMPELGWRFGYFWVWGLILTIGGSLAVYFKRRGWL